MTSELKILPCAHCGGTSLDLRSQIKGRFVCCTNEDCEAEGPTAVTKEDARAAWNRRADYERGIREALAVVERIERPLSERIDDEETHHSSTLWGVAVEIGAGIEKLLPAGSEERK